MTIENLGRNNVEEDLGTEIRAALLGLMTETLDVEALLAYIESREESSWIVRNSVESSTRAREAIVTWAQAYENAKGGCSFWSVGTGDDKGSGGHVTLQIFVDSWGDELDAQLGPAVNPMLLLHISLGSDGRLDGRVILDLRVESGQIIPASPVEPGSAMAKFMEDMKRQAEVASKRIAELRTADALPREVRWRLDSSQRELIYYAHGSSFGAPSSQEFEASRRSSRLLTDGEIDAIRRLYDRYQAAAKQHVAAASAAPLSAK
ncbi:MAG: hypothetical protein EXR73_04900 [Myxococcales bacterium]|nr:hypothetical protein [Myxococcales bacterium]